MLFYENLQSFISGERIKLDALANHNLPDRGVVLKVFAPSFDQDKVKNVAGYSVTYASEYIELDDLGIKGDRHRMATRHSSGRERDLYPKGTTIRGHRHVFAVSPFDCKVLSGKLGVEVTPELLGANLLIGRTDDKDYSLSALPQNTHLLLAPWNAIELPRPPIATLVHYTQQQGCGITGNTIAQKYGDKDLTQRFIEHSKQNRGIVCQVEYPVDQFARIEPGQAVFFRYPLGVTP